MSTLQGLVGIACSPLASSLLWLRQINSCTIGDAANQYIMEAIVGSPPSPSLYSPFIYSSDISLFHHSCHSHNLYLSAFAACLWRPDVSCLQNNKEHQQQVFSKQMSSKERAALPHLQGGCQVLLQRHRITCFSPQLNIIQPSMNFDED